MDMKKILQAIDGVSAKSVQGANDMKKFVSIIRESASPKSVEETVISSFEAGSVGGDANEFLLAADKINDEVMAQVERIKINADEALLRDMMDKFNNFMTSYHAVGKDILQPDMFNDSMGESYPKQQDLSGVSTEKLKAYLAKQGQQQSPGEGNQVKRVRAELQSREQSVAEGSAHGYNVAKWYEKNGDQLKLTKWLRKEAGLPKDADVYFDDVDLVYGDQTIVPGALVNPKLKFNDLLTAVVQATGGTPKQKVDGVYRSESVAESEQRMSRAAKGHEKYGKAGMAALAKAGRDGAGEEKLDKIRDKHNKYDDKVDEAAKKGLYYNVNKRKKAGTSRDASSPKAPTAQAWKDAAKTAKKESVREGLSFTDYVNLAESKQLSKK